MKAKISQAKVGARLKLLREAKGYDEQKEWAELLAVTPPRYNNWERGRQVIPLENAVRVSELTGVSLDFIYLGDKSALPKHLLALVEGSEG